MDGHPHSSARTLAAATPRRRSRARRWLLWVVVLLLLGGSALGALDSLGVVDLGDWTRASVLRTRRGARELAQALSENVPVYRVQLGATTCNLPGAGTDDTVHVRLNAGNGTWLDYSQNDFERAATFTYDLGLDGVAALRDIALLEISTDGDDAWCLRDVTLLVNNEVIFRRTYPPAGRWLSQVPGGRRALAFSGEHLRSHPSWEGYRPSLPPNPIPRAELESRMESAVGNALHGQQVTWRRLPGRAVALTRAGRLTYAGALELEARLDNWADPEIRVTFHLAISCRSGQLTMRVRKLAFQVDSPWYADVASFGMVDKKVEQRLRTAVEGLSLTRSTALFVCPPALGITKDGDLKLY